ncbi:carbon monoxide dehydrogenase subunit G [Streptomyces sp. PvR006]|uniref:SRPBCC family protein n=1 Tax=unclassified Streptomyces TaxID=2593676 RepID=UPI001AE955E4|nr:SRPBCC family protein [Streptomyces sp. PvR006]MBP2579685.1 carbon monoxide dehydrogenase subunit G [Streptomyces sp. PvR006]
MKPRTLERSTVLAATPDAVWAVVGDFGALADWHPHLPPSRAEEDGDPEVPGTVRVFAVEGTVVARERLLDHDADARSYRYALLDPLVLPVHDYVATLAVRPHPEGSEVTWSAVYRSEDDVAAQVESLFGDGTYGPGLAALRARLTSSR